MNSGALEFWYDGKNRQITRRINGDNNQITRSVWDGWNLLEERNVNDAPLEYYLHGARTDELVLRWGGAQGDNWYGYDGRGNVSLLMGYNGLIIERYTYDLAGKPTITPADVNGNSLSGNRFLFQGRDYLKEGGIYDYRNRFYHPGLGRFLQPDPIGFKGDAENLYRYCGNDPVDRSDPTGLYPIVNISFASGLLGPGRYAFSDSSGSADSGTSESQGGAATGRNADGRSVTMAFRTIEVQRETRPGHKTYLKWRDAADSVSKEVDSRTQGEKREYWAPFGYDPHTHRWAAGSVFPGNEPDKVKDKYNPGKIKVHNSQVSRGDLPSEYRWRGYVLGHVNYDLRYVADDFNRARDAHLNALIILPKVTGQIRQTDFAYEYRP